MQSVKCWKTVTPHFVVTEPLCDVDEPLYNVTHVRSTALALGPFRDLAVASMCAAVIGLLPMPWDDFSMAVSTQFHTPDPDMEKRFRDAWMKLPKEIHVWRKAVSNACMVGEL
jgi:hypothetical protein